MYVPHQCIAICDVHSYRNDDVCTCDECNKNNMVELYLMVTLLNYRSKSIIIVIANNFGKMDKSNFKARHIGSLAASYHVVCLLTVFEILIALHTSYICRASY